MPVANENTSAPRAFFLDLWMVNWPPSFKITGVRLYEGRTDPRSWLRAYATAVRAARGNTSVMVNYLPVMLSTKALNWLNELSENSIHSWDELMKTFIDNYITTFERPGTKHDLARVTQGSDESLREYICCFAESRYSIPNITEMEVINAF